MTPAEYKAVHAQAVEIVKSWDAYEIDAFTRKPVAAHLAAEPLRDPEVTRAIYRICRAKASLGL